MRRHDDADRLGATKATSGSWVVVRITLCTLNASGSSFDSTTPFRLAGLIVAVRLVASATRASKREPNRWFRSFCIRLRAGDLS